MYQLVANPEQPWTTIGGSTKGPCVYVGYPVVQGAPVLVGEQETRSILKTLGWPQPEQHAELAAELAEVKARLAETETRLAEAIEHVNVLERALDWKPKPAPAPKPEPKPAKATAGKAA